MIRISGRDLKVRKDGINAMSHECKSNYGHFNVFIGLEQKLRKFYMPCTFCNIIHRMLGRQVTWEVTFNMNMLGL